MKRRAQGLWRRVRHGVAISTCTLTLLAPVAAQQPAAGGDDFRALLSQGFSLHQHADYRNALPLLRRAWKLRPHDYFTNLLIGIDLLRTGRAEEALSYLKEASRGQPKEDFPYEYTGEAQAQLGHYAEAAAAYSHALEVAPTSSQAIEGAMDYAVERFRRLSGELRSTAKGLAAEHRLQAVSHPVDDPMRRELLARSAGLDPEAPGIWSDLALAALAAGDLPQARESEARALRENPDDLRAMEAEALLAAHSGAWNKAFAELNAIADRSRGFLAKALADWPRELQPPANAHPAGAASTFLACAREQVHPCTAQSFAAGAATGTRSSMSARPSPEALFRQQQWERLIGLPAPRAEDTDGWFRRGVALAETGGYEQAIPALERALRSQSNGVYARYLLCWCYAKEAGRVTTLLQEGEGDAAVVHLVRGDVLLRMQANSAGAITEYTAALNQHPDDPKLLERLAEAQFENGSADRAAESAQAALRVDPYRFSAMETLARIGIEQRKYAEALPYLQQLTAHDPGDAAAQVELGTALAKTGKASEALEHLRPPLQKGYPDEKGSLHALLGSILRQVGRNDEAAQAFAQARSLSDAYQRGTHGGGDEQK